LNGHNFTERVRKILAMSRESAATFHHEYVSTEHILHGLLREGEGVAAAVLQNLGADLEELKARLEGCFKPGNPAAAPVPDLPYTSRGKKVLELAMAEARDFSHSYVGSEHLLIALLREEHGIAAKVLAEAKLTADGLRAETLRLLGTEIRNSTTEIPKVLGARLVRKAQQSVERELEEIKIEIRHHDGSTVRGEFRNASTAMVFLRNNTHL